MANDRWNEAIQRVLARIEDTARQVGDCDCDGDYYFFESLLTLAGIVDPVKL